MKAVQLKDLVIQPALEKIELYSPEAVALVLGTACVESQCGEFLRQYGFLATLVGRRFCRKT